MHLDMKKVLLILLAIMLPLQVSASAAFGFMHALQGSQGYAFSFKHFSEHADHVAHHHDDDDDDEHEDDSPASTQHLLNYDHGFGIYALIPASTPVSSIDLPRAMPMCKHKALVSRTISPPLRPPYMPA